MNSTVLSCSTPSRNLQVTPNDSNPEAIRSARRYWHTLKFVHTLVALPPFFHFIFCFRSHSLHFSLVRSFSFLSRFFSPHSSTPSSCVDVLYHRPLFIIVLFFFISFACCPLVIVFSLRFSCCVLDLASFFPLSFHPHSFSLILIKEDSTNMMKKKR